MVDRKKLDDPSRTEAYDPELDVNNRGYKAPPAAPRRNVPGGVSDVSTRSGSAYAPNSAYEVGTRSGSAYAPATAAEMRQILERRRYNKGGKVGGHTVHNYCAGGKVISSKNH